MIMGAMNKDSCVNILNSLLVIQSINQIYMHFLVFVLLYFNLFHLFATNAAAKS